MLQREEAIDSRAAEQDRREQSIRDRDANSQRLSDELNNSHAEAMIQLERISGLSAAQAKEMLLKQTEDEARHEMAKLIRQIDEEARRESDRRARNILSLSIQRTAANHVAETTVSVVHLPSDDMKGRIIGREGRNIRTLENITGIDFIIDDTPEAVVLSGFDGVRREIARLTLTKLITDGRIHPARIEETYTAAKAEVEAAMQEAGEQACFDTNVHGVAPELVKVLGRLKYRTSYGQNVLKHSLEVAHLAGIMAAELGVERQARQARRPAPRPRQGHRPRGRRARTPTSAQQLCKKYRESQSVVPRHRGAPPGRRAADRGGRARAGGRRDQRPPVPEPAARRSRATSSGSRRSRRSPRPRRASRRATRCRPAARSASWSSPERSTTTPTPSCSRTRSPSEIEDELEYPGQIRVIVIRESRAVDIAK